MLCLENIFVVDHVLSIFSTSEQFLQYATAWMRTPITRFTNLTNKGQKSEIKNRENLLIKFYRFIIEKI